MKSEIYPKDLKSLPRKNSQNVYELMLKHGFQIQEGLKKAKSETK
jgi:hypothetical protein